MTEKKEKEVLEKMETEEKKLLVEEEDVRVAQMAGNGGLKLSNLAWRFCCSYASSPNQSGRKKIHASAQGHRVYFLSGGELKSSHPRCRPRGSDTAAVPTDPGGPQVARIQLPSHKPRWVNVVAVERPSRAERAEGRWLGFWREGEG
jgi:hypothetical protein